MTTVAPRLLARSQSGRLCSCQTDLLPIETAHTLCADTHLTRCARGRVARSLRADGQFLRVLRGAQVGIAIEARSSRTRAYARSKLGRNGGQCASLAASHSLLLSRS